ncbi:hypothetical protein [uncultured Streptococcus sp.]|uniref:hypothetical protein n=1 Tax=uncultured Streptococcus sp. TaxID=83427 RepID=UPI0027DC7029|nr:hypothetical protein [uncultured Streptococcus sp.]
MTNLRNSFVVRAITFIIGIIIVYQLMTKHHDPSQMRWLVGGLFSLMWFAQGTFWGGVKVTFLLLFCGLILKISFWLLLFGLIAGAGGTTYVGKVRDQYGNEYDVHRRY